MTKSLIGLAIIALVATIGDSIWFEFGLRDQIAFGVVHGAVLLMAVGGVLGERSGRVLPGLLMGAAAGIGGATVYYVLGSSTRIAAMLVAWVTVWILLSVFDGLILRRGSGRSVEIITRWLAAALLSGISFYMVVGILWGHESAGGRNYWRQFFAWVVAWGPGMLALTMPFSNRSDVPVDQRS